MKTTTGIEYVTTVRCPVCSTIMDEIKHPEPELSGMAAALLLGDSRRIHAKHSPQCKESDKWFEGWTAWTRLTDVSREKLGLVREDRLPGPAM